VKQFLNILSHFKEYFVLALCIILSVYFLTLNDNAQIKTIRALAVVGIGFAQEAFSFIPNYFALKKENTILRERNVALADEVSLLRESKLENLRLRGMIGLKERAPFTYIPAKVVGKHEQQMRTTITLDVGESDGVKYNMPMVTDAGLVGKVVATSRHYAIGQILFHKDFRASAKIQRARADGILYWDGEDLRIKNVPRTQLVKVGDAVITSPFSSVFPPGIKIGVVSTAVIESNALFYQIVVQPSVDLAALDEVFVIAAVPDSERVALEQQFTK
jgi:rod shape-determining protein MreC